LPTSRRTATSSRPKEWDAVADAIRPLPPPPHHDHEPDEVPDDDNLPPLTAAERAVLDLGDDAEA